MKAVEYVEGGRDLLRDHIEVLPPHVAADEADSCPDLGGERGEEATAPLNDRSLR